MIEILKTLPLSHKVRANILSLGDDLHPLLPLAWYTLNSLTSAVLPPPQSLLSVLWMDTPSLLSPPAFILLCLGCSFPSQPRGFSPVPTPWDLSSNITLLERPSLTYLKLQSPGHLAGSISRRWLLILGLWVWALPSAYRLKVKSLKNKRKLQSPTPHPALYSQDSWSPSLLSFSS